MNNTEKFILFDKYIQSIDGLDSSIKKQVSLYARSTMESITSINAPSLLEDAVSPASRTNDVASLSNLTDFVTKVAEALNPKNNYTITGELLGKVNDIVMKIETLVDDPNVEHLDTSNAFNLINSLPDTKPKITALNAKLSELRGMYSGWNEGMTVDELRNIKKEVKSIREEIEMLKNIAEPYERIRASLTRLNKAIINKRDIEAHRRVNEMTMRQQAKARDISETRGKTVSSASTEETMDTVADTSIATIDAIRDSVVKLIDTVKLNATNIYNMYRAIKMQNKEAANGTPSTLQSKLEKYPSDISLFDTADNGSYLYIAPTASIPLRVAYDMSIDGISMNKLDNQFIVAENAKQKRTTIVNGEKQFTETYVRNWNIVFTLNNAGNTVEIVATHKKTSNPSPTVAPIVELSLNTQPDQIVKAAFDALGQVLPVVKTI